ncbi:tyrosine-type recombinase/integrase [Bacillus mycoides]|uniref:tyrosine-type recombinase/integrase n=1 Tax=Bacillus mycoides TaxID=1405 RepID=UPI0010BEE7FB|nr:tyrosine-type recombinase/integrase [Bacillus mycoides]TKI39930.1 hypothetical protein FC700_20965 [Bacillus mycoides]
MHFSKDRDRELLIKLLKALPTYIEGFVRDKQPYMSTGTLLNYVRCYKDFLKWLLDNSCSKAIKIKDISLEELDELGLEQINEYVLYLRNDKKNTSGTINSKLSSLQSLLNYLVNSIDFNNGGSLFRKNVFSEVEYCKVLKSTVLEGTKEELLSNEKIDSFRYFIKCDYGMSKRVSALAKARWEQNRYRDTAIASLMLGSGLQVGEVARLNMGDVNLESRTISLRKNGRINKTAYSLKAARDLELYLEVRKEQYGGDDSPSAPLFVTRFKGDLQPITKNTIQKLIMKYANAFGMPEMTAKVLRKSFAVNNYQKNKDLVGLKDILGVKQISTVDKYITKEPVNIKRLIDNGDS